MTLALPLRYALLSHNCNNPVAFPMPMQALEQFEKRIKLFEQMIGKNIEKRVRLFEETFEQKVEQPFRRIERKSARTSRSAFG